MNRATHPQLQAVLLNEEHILWWSTPRLLPFLLRGTVQWSAMTTVILAALLFAEEYMSGWGLVPGSVWAAMWVCVLFGVFTFVGRALASQHSIYALTDHRVIIMKGYLKSVLYSLPLKQLNDTVLSVDPIERLAHVGTVRFLVGVKKDERSLTKVHECWFAVPRPLDVFKLVEEQKRSAQ